MVQLKHEKQGFLLVGNGFQFHNGTIKTCNLYQGKRVQKHFNSIMVQLKRDDATAAAMNVIFQFHNGTIKTLHLSV